VLNFKLKKNKDLKSKKPRNLSPQNPKILEVNLIKDEMRESFNLAKHGKTLLFTLLVTALFVLEIYLGLNWWSTYEEKRLMETESLFNDISEKIRNMKKESDQVAAFRQRVELADALLNRHVYWSNFFVWLEQNTLSSVSYQDFSGTNNGEYNLSASTRAFRDVSWQARLFLADPSVISVSIDQGSGDRDFENIDNNHNGDNINFSIDLKIDPKIFNSSEFK
jgi:hypothetical protein